MREIGVGSGVHYSTVCTVWYRYTCHVVPVVPGTRTTRQHIFITHVCTRQLSTGADNLCVWCVHSSVFKTTRVQIN